MSTDKRGYLLDSGGNVYFYPCSQGGHYVHLVPSISKPGWYVLGCGHGFVSADDAWLVADLQRAHGFSCPCDRCAAKRASASRPLRRKRR